VDPRGSRSPRQAEGVTYSRPHSHTTDRRRAPLPIRSCDDPSGQRGGRCGKTRGGPCSACPTAGVLHQRSTVRDQDAVSADPETAIRNSLGSAQAAPLLRGPSRHRGLVFPPGRDSPQ